MLITNGTWIPAGAGRWHHFTVTRDRAPDREDVVRVAYELTDGDATPIRSYPDDDADRAAERHLSSDARDAWRARRAAERAAEERPDDTWRERLRCSADDPRDTCDEDYL